MMEVLWPGCPPLVLIVGLELQPGKHIAQDPPYTADSWQRVKSEDMEALGWSPSLCRGQEMRL